MIKKLLLYLLEANATEVIGHTGHKCYISGIYRNKDQYIPLSKGETFPPSLDFNVAWILVVSV
jgi:hypothetical protein